MTRFCQSFGRTPSRANVIGKLGFSDLADDEALLLAAYRDWVRTPSAKVFIERWISPALSREAIHGALRSIFAASRNVTPERTDLSGRSALLSAKEEDLLDGLAVRLARKREISGRGAFSVRPATARKRSGHDDLIEKICEVQSRFGSAIFVA